MISREHVSAVAVAAAVHQGRVRVPCASSATLGNSTERVNGGLELHTHEFERPFLGPGSRSIDCRSGGGWGMQRCCVYGVCGVTVCGTLIEMRLNADASKFAPVGFSWPTPPSTSLSAFPCMCGVAFVARARVCAWRATHTQLNRCATGFLVEADPTFFI